MHLRVLRSHLKGEQGADVAEQGRFRLLVHLGQVLIGEREAQPVLPGLGQDRRERFGGEVLKLVDVDEEIGRRSVFGNIRPAHRRDLEARHEQRPQEHRRVVADPALAQVDDEHLAAVHHAPQIEPVHALPDDVPEQGMS